MAARLFLPDEGERGGASRADTSIDGLLRVGILGVAVGGITVLVAVSQVGRTVEPGARLLVPSAVGGRMVGQRVVEAAEHGLAAEQLLVVLQEGVLADDKLGQGGEVLQHVRNLRSLELPLLLEHRSASRILVLVAHDPVGDVERLERGAVLEHAGVVGDAFGVPTDQLDALERRAVVEHVGHVGDLANVPVVALRHEVRNARQVGAALEHVGHRGDLARVEVGKEREVRKVRLAEQARHVGDVLRVERPLVDTVDCGQALVAVEQVLQRRDAAHEVAPAAEAGDAGHDADLEFLRIKKRSLFDMKLHISTGFQRIAAGVADARQFIARGRT